MKLKIAWAFIGVVLSAFVLGLVGGGLAVLTQGIGWLALFGDNPWPQWYKLAQNGLMLVWFLVIMPVSSIFFGWQGVRHADRIASHRRGPQTSGVSTIGWLLVAIAVIVFSSVYFVQRSHSSKHSRADYAASQRILSEMRKIDGVTVEIVDPNIVLDIHAVGQRNGRYEVTIDMSSDTAGQFFSRTGGYDINTDDLSIPIDKKGVEKAFNDGVAKAGKVKLGQQAFALDQSVIIRVRSRYVGQDAANLPNTALMTSFGETTISLSFRCSVSGVCQIQQ